MRTEQEVKVLLLGVLSGVKAEMANVEYVYRSSVATRFGENSITQNMGGENENIRLIVANGKKQGSSITNKFDKESLANLIKTAEAIAAVSPDDPEFMPPVEPQTYPKVPQRFYDDVLKMTPLEIAEDIAIVISAAKTMNYKASGLFEVSFGSNAIANSKGLFAFDKSTSVEYSTTIHGPKGSGSHSAFGESRKQVDAKEIAQAALTTAISAQNPADIEPGDYTVIFEPAAVLDLLEFLPYDMNARDADEGTTYFSGKVGEKMFPDKLNIYTEIFNPMLPGKHFGEDGLAGRRIDWVKKGVLERLRHERFWAKEKGLEPDPAIFPLYMDGEDRSLEDLIKSCKDGLLVKRFWYIRYVDRREYLLTGMTRDGFFRIKDGKIVGAVKNLRFNESPIILLKNITAMSRPKRVLSYAVVPGIMSENFTFSSKTESL